MGILRGTNEKRYLLDIIAKGKIEWVRHAVRHNILMINIIETKISEKRAQNIGYISATSVMSVKKQTLTDSTDRLPIERHNCLNKVGRLRNLWFGSHATCEPSPYSYRRQLSIVLLNLIFTIIIDCTETLTISTRKSTSISSISGNA